MVMHRVANPRRVKNRPQVRVLYPPPKICSTSKFTKKRQKIFASLHKSTVIYTNPNMKFDKILDFAGFSYMNKENPADVTNAKNSQPSNVVETKSDAPLGPKEIYLSWSAPSRTIFSNISTKGKKTMVVLGIVFCVLLALMQEFLLIFAIAAVLYMTYALSKMTPENVNIEVSNHGVKYGTVDYLWSDFSQYFFKRDGGQEILAIDTYKRLPARLFLLIDEKNKVELDKVFSQRLLKLDKEPETVIDRVYKKTASKLNFDKTASN